MLLDQCDMHLRPDPGSLPRDHPGSGVVAPWLPPGQLHGISSASPCVCVGGGGGGLLNHNSGWEVGRPETKAMGVILEEQRTAPTQLNRSNAKARV